MTKEELLKGEYSKLIMNPEKVYAQNPSIIQAAHTAMDEWAAQRAIAFAEWFGDHELDFQPTHISGTWIGINLEKITTQQLYNLFLEHINKQQ